MRDRFHLWYKEISIDFHSEEFMSKNTSWIDDLGELLKSVLKEILGGKK